MDRPVECFKNRILEVMKKKGSIYSSVGLPTCCLIPSGGLRSLEEEDRFKQAIKELLMEDKIGIKSSDEYPFYCLPS